MLFKELSILLIVKLVTKKTNTNQIAARVPGGSLEVPFLTKVTLPRSLETSQIFNILFPNIACGNTQALIYDIKKKNVFVFNLAYVLSSLAMCWRTQWPGPNSFIWDAGTITEPWRVHWVLKEWEIKTSA